MRSKSLRDRQPYSTRYTSKGALVKEAALVIGTLSSGKSIEEVRKQTLDGALLNQRTRASRNKIWRDLHYRLLGHRIDWLIESLKQANANGSQSPEFMSLVYLCYTLRDHLTYDVVTGLVWRGWTNNQLQICREDILSMLDDASQAQPQICRWAESSRLKLASNILTALRDFGVLKGAQRKRIVRPVLPLFTAEQLLHALISEGVRGRKVLEDSTWRLFLCSEDDVADVLGRLSQAGRIDFERAGSTVVLQTPRQWEEEK